MEKGWSILFGVVLGACLALFVVAPFIDGWWLPELANKGSFGSGADLLFYVILGLTGFFFVLTEAILVYCMWKYTYSPKRRSAYTHGNHKLEMWWTIVPAVILLFIAFAQINVWADIKYTSHRPNPDQIIAVTARQFEWRMRYPDSDQRESLIKVWKPGIVGESMDAADQWGRSKLANVSDLHTVNEVHTWKGAKTLIYLRSNDVLHSFFLPNLRLKQDAIPGKVIPIWFEATSDNTEYVEVIRDAEIKEDSYKPGEWRLPPSVYERVLRDRAAGTQRLFILDRIKDESGKTTKFIALSVPKTRLWELACAELCGWGHYKMRGRLFVHKDKEDYDKWLRLQLREHHSHQRKD